MNLDKLLWITKSWDLYQVWEEKVQSERSTCTTLYMCWISEQVRENERKHSFFPACLHNICLTWLSTWLNPDGRIQVDFSSGSHHLHISKQKATETLISSLHWTVFRKALFFSSFLFLYFSPKDRCWQTSPPLPMPKACPIWLWSYS